jgi:hypothetical protein
MSSPDSWQRWQLTDLDSQTALQLGSISPKRDIVLVLAAQLERTDSSVCLAEYTVAVTAGGQYVPAEYD